MELLKFRGKKGSGVVSAWIGGFAAIFMIVISWVIFTPILNSVVSSLASSTSNEQVLHFFTVLQTIWRFVPLLFVLAWAIWIIVASLRREPYDEVLQ